HGSGHDRAADQRMDHQMDASDRLLAGKIVAGEHCRCWYRGQDVAGKLGARDAEEDDRNQSPKQEEERQPVVLLTGLFRRTHGRRVATILEIRDGRTAGKVQRWKREGGPGNRGSQKNGNVVPKWLRVLVEVGSKTGQVMFQKKDSE